MKPSMKIVRETGRGLKSGARPRAVLVTLTVLLALALVALTAMWLLLRAGRGQRGAASARHVLVISIDGMASGYYMEPPPGLQIPNLRRLMAQGSYAEAVAGVYPTLTYPSHTTLVTGCLPAEHGIYTNLSSREPGRNPDDYFWFAKAIRKPTLWDEARAHGLTTSSVAWPVTAGAPIDWDVPEIWDPTKPPAPDALYVARFMKPLVTLELLMALGRPRPGAEDDENRVRIAACFLSKHQPNLMLVHLEGLDHTEHASGPYSDAANQALERLDGHVEELLRALKQAGLESSTDVFLLSDHGFLPVEREIHPNILLAQAGLLQVNASGNITGGKVATVANGGSFFVYWPEGSDLGAEVKTALAPLSEQGLASAVLDRESLRALGADPEAQLALDAPDGAEYGDDAMGALVKQLPGREGNHGYLPSRAGLDSVFVAIGPDIRSGVDLHRVPMTRIAPTILEAMGIHDPHFGDLPPLETIFKTDPSVTREPSP
jgi:predicted AlkP superfamily pyrophosphatase or phosphodiesterase